MDDVDLIEFHLSRQRNTAIALLSVLLLKSYEA